MHTPPYNYSQIIGGSYRVETKVEIWNYFHPFSIHGWNYSDHPDYYTTPIGTVPENYIISLTTNSSLFDRDDFSVGCCTSREIDLEFFPLDSSDQLITFPKDAMLKVYVRIYDINNNQSGWIQKGVFFIDSKEDDPSSRKIKVHGFDAIDRLSLPRLAKGNFNTNSTIFSVIQKIAEVIGVTMGSIDTLSTSERMTQEKLDAYNKDIKSFLCGIAAEYCISFFINEDGNLMGKSIFPPSTSPSGRDTINTSNTELIKTSDNISYTIVSVVDSDGNSHSSTTAPSTAGNELTVNVPWGTSDTADDILALIGNFTYKPFSADKVTIEPIYELGDNITINSTYSKIYKQELVFGTQLVCDIKAPYNETNIPEVADSILSLRAGGRSGVDHISRYGMAGIWKYEVWNSGKIIAYTSYSPSVAVTQQYGAFYSSADIQVSFPSNLFGVEPKCFMSISKTSGHDAFLVTSDDVSATDTPKFKIISPTSWTDYVDVDICAVYE